MRKALTLFALLALTTSVRTATAGQVRISGDLLDMDLSTHVGRLRLFGDRQFRFESTVGDLTGVFEAGGCNFSICLPGTRVSLRAAWTGSDIPGTASLDFVTYPDVGGANSPSQMTVEFSGSFVLPPVTASKVTVSAPFTFSGTFVHPIAAAEQLSGSGRAVVTLSLIEASGSWHVDAVQYQFASDVHLPWSTTDVGPVGISGRGLERFGSFFLDGAGADIWGSADAFRFVFRPVIDDAEIVARVIEQSSAHPLAKAGIMLRASVAPGSPHAILAVLPGGGLEFMVRPVPGGNTQFVSGGQTAPMPWLKLVRAGNQLTASHSEDGTNWITLGSIDVGELPRDLFAGLAVTSHDPAALNHAVFDDVIVTSNPAAHNLLISGGFEEYVPPSFEPLGWKSDHAFRQRAAMSETNQPRTGMKNGACWTPEFLDCGLYQDVIAPVTASYTLRLYANADRHGGLVGVNVNGSLAISAGVEPREFGNYGVSYELPFKASSGDNIRVWMYSPATPGYVVIDDATLMLDEPLSITEGEWAIGFPGPFGRFSLTSGNGVAITGSYDDGPVEPRGVCGDSAGRCAAGDVVRLSSSFGNEEPLTIASFARGIATIGVTSHPFVELGGQINVLGGAVTLPEPAGGVFPELISVTAPFVLTGDLKGWEVLQRRDPKLVFDLPFVGHGTATLDLLTSPGPNGPTMTFFRLRYVFEP